MNYRIPLTAVLLCFYAVVGSEEITENEASDAADDSGLHTRVRRGGLSMLRLGRGLQMLRLGKRALPMLRLGRSASSGLTDDELQYLLSLVRSGRTVPLPRYGKDLSFEYMLMNLLKNAELNNEMYDEEADEPEYGYGYDLGSAPERHIRPAPRPGMRYRRSTDTQETEQREVMKRAVPVARYGKQLSQYGYEDEDEEVVKRAMRMLRLGRGMRMLRLGKRPMGSDSLEESESAASGEEEASEADKRALRLLRLGKRPFKMLRLGRSGDSASDSLEETENKRALHLLRLGRSGVDES